MRSSQKSISAAKPLLSLRRVVVLAVPPVEELDIVGPWEVFTTANNALRGKRWGYEVELVTTSRQRLFTGDSGLSLLAKRRYNEVRGEVDTLVVPGGRECHSASGSASACAVLAPTRGPGSI